MSNRIQSYQLRCPGLNLIAKAIRKMGKSTQLTIVITSMAVVGSAACAIGHFSASNLLIASVGGLVVFAGLWIEKDADEDKEKHLGKFSSAKRLIKFRSNIGWWVLIFGIGIEIADAGWTAHEIRKTEVTAAKNNPLNQPIVSVIAHIEFLQFGTNRTNIDPGNFESRGPWVRLMVGNFDQLKSNRSWSASLLVMPVNVV